MTYAQGFQSHLLMVIESTYGVTPATPEAVKLPIVSSQIKGDQNLTEDKIIRGRVDPAMPGKGNVNVSGSIGYVVDEVGIGWVLRALLGAPTTTGTGDPYTHVFKPGLTMPSMALEQGFTDISQYELFNGCMFGGLSIPFGGEGDIEASIDVMGAKSAIAETSVDDTPAEVTITKFQQFQASIKEGGSSIAYIESGNLNINRSLDGNYYPIGLNGTRGMITPGLAQISGDITAFFQDAALLTKAINGTKSSLEIKWTNGTHELSFLLPEIIYNRTSPTIDGPAGVRINLSFRAFYQSASEGSCLVATLKNAQASYASIS